MDLRRDAQEGTMIEVKPSTCRVCSAYCPVMVTLDEGNVVRVDGNHDAPLYGGFTCPKGRALPALHNNPDRLLHSLKRQPDGSFRSIPTDVAIAEIAEKLKDIVARHGPRSVAGFLGNPGVEQVATAPMMMSLLRAVGSPMFFTMATLDQPNTKIADALHGAWEGGRMRPESLDVFLITGGNPVIFQAVFRPEPRHSAQGAGAPWDQADRHRSAPDRDRAPRRDSSPAHSRRGFDHCRRPRPPDHCHGRGQPGVRRAQRRRPCRADRGNPPVRSELCRGTRRGARGGATRRRKVAGGGQARQFRHRHRLVDDGARHAHYLSAELPSDAARLLVAGRGGGDVFAGAAAPDPSPRPAAQTLPCYWLRREDAGARAGAIGRRHARRSADR